MNKSRSSLETRVETKFSLVIWSIQSKASAIQLLPSDFHIKITEILFLKHFQGLSVLMQPYAERKNMD